MDTDIVILVNYPCPRCDAALEAASGDLPRWLRCPSCGRASQPPEHTRRSRPSAMVPSTVASIAAPSPPRPRGMAPLPGPPPSRVPMTRLLLGTGFFLTMILSLFSLLESKGAQAGFSGFAAAVFLLLLSRGSRKPAGEPS